jgi:hypothetical protein
MVLHDVIFNVTAFDLNVKSLFFIKKFYKFHNVGILIQDSHLLLLINLRVRFKPCVFNLIRSCAQKIQKRRKTI